MFIITVFKNEDRKINYDERGKKFVETRLPLANMLR